MPGPPPKRTDQRRRANRPVTPVEIAEGASVVKPPPTNGKWHPVAKRWFQSLRDSGQAKFYEPSDWATAYLIAEAMSRELQPQPVGTTEDGKVVMASLPPKGASLSAWLRAMTSLMVTEGDRRRLRLELQRPDDGDEEATSVSELDEYRRRLSSS